LISQTFHHIFTGPGSAEKDIDKPAEGSHKSNASIHKMKEVTPQQIAYAAVQVLYFLSPLLSFHVLILKLKAHFAISSCETWGTKVMNFLHVNFYKHIVEVFEKMGPEWHKETLDWWKR